MSQQLNLPIVRKEKMLLQAFESCTEEPRLIDVVSARLKRDLNSEKCIEVELLVVPKICSLISSQYFDMAQATYSRIRSRAELLILKLIYYWEQIFNGVLLRERQFEENVVQSRSKPYFDGN